MSDPQEHVIQIPISHLQPNPHQPRAEKLDPFVLQELMVSIQQHGILEPLVVAKTPVGYQIIAGERRWMAAKKAGLTTVPCVIKEANQKGMLEMAIVENEQRVDLNPLDRAKAFSKLMKEHNLSASEIATRMGKSESYVSNTLKLLTLPDALKDGLLSGMIQEGHARALLAIPDERAMIEAYKTLMKEDGSVRRAEDLARRAKQQLGHFEFRGNKPVILSKQVDEWQMKLQTAFGENSKVELNRSRMQTRIVIVLKGNSEETQPQLNRILRLAKKPIPALKSKNDDVEVEGEEIY